MDLVVERRVEPSQTTEFHLYTSAQRKVARTSRKGLNHIGRDSRDSLPVAARRVLYTSTTIYDVVQPPSLCFVPVFLPVASSRGEKKKNGGEDLRFNCSKKSQQKRMRSSSSSSRVWLCGGVMMLNIDH